MEGNKTRLWVFVGRISGVRRVTWGGRRLCSCCGTSCLTSQSRWVKHIMISRSEEEPGEHWFLNIISPPEWLALNRDGEKSENFIWVLLWLSNHSGPANVIFHLKHTVTFHKVLRFHFHKLQWSYQLHENIKSWPAPRCVWLAHRSGGARLTRNND